MASADQILFWIASFLIIYTYAGYPLLVWVLAKCAKILRKKRVFTRVADLPRVSLIVAAYNEKKIIAGKVRNTLELDYPKELLEIIFITDGSTDGTDGVVAQNDNIILMHQPDRQGKLAAINRAVRQSTSPILIFSDANTLLNRDAIRLICRHFEDSRVGGVSGEKRISGDPEMAMSSGEGLYWRYESWLKRNDSDLYTTVGAAGELFSIRKSMFTLLPATTILDDFVQSLKICEKGQVVRYEPDAFAIENASLSVNDEMERKTRISAGAFQAMGMLGRLFNPFHFPIISFQFISHRILRWTLCPLALPALLITNFAIILRQDSQFYLIIMGIQAIGYLIAGIGWILADRGLKVNPFYFAFYVLFMHYCVFAGFLRFLRRKQSVLWASAGRKG